jgi:hypothetical protein
MNDVMMVVKRFDCEVLENEMQLFCRMKIGIPKIVEEDCLLKLKDIQGIEVNR